MKLTGSTFIIVALVGVLFATGSVFAQEKTGTDVTKEQLQKLYMDYLAKEGYPAEVDKDGDVVFKRESRSYFIDVDDRDPGFFTIVMPNIWPIESEEERAKVLAAADFANAKSKVTKIYTNRDNVWVSVEIFVAKPEDFAGVFPRLLLTMDRGIEHYVAKMRE